MRRAGCRQSRHTISHTQSLLGPQSVASAKLDLCWKNPREALAQRQIVGLGVSCHRGCPVVAKAYSPTRSPVTLLLDSYDKFNLGCLNRVLAEFLHGRGPRKEVLGRFGNATTRGVSTYHSPGQALPRSNDF